MHPSPGHGIPTPPTPQVTVPLPPAPRCCGTDALSLCTCLASPLLDPPSSPPSGHHAPLPCSSLLRSRHSASPPAWPQSGPMASRTRSKQGCVMNDGWAGPRHNDGCASWFMTGCVLPGWVDGCCCPESKQGCVMDGCRGVEQTLFASLKQPRYLQEAGRISGSY